MYQLGRDRTKSKMKHIHFVKKVVLLLLAFNYYFECMKIDIKLRTNL